MKTITHKSNYGNFDYEASVIVPEENLSALVLAYILQGIANVCYRVAGSACDKALEVDKTKGEFAGKRRGVEYNQTNAELLATTVNEKISELAKAKTDPIPAGLIFTVTGQHEFGTVADSKFIEELELIARHESGDDWEEWVADVVGFKGDTHAAVVEVDGKKTGGDLNVEFLRAVRSYKVEALKKLRQGL